MILDLENIDSLTSFRQRSKEFLIRLKETTKPIVLTVNGQAEVVVQDAKSYQALLERLERAEAVAGIWKSMQEFEKGQGIPVRDAFEKLRKEHGLSD